MSRSKVISSAGVVVHLNGIPFGRVSTFEWNSQTPRKPQYGLDALEPYELIPTSTRITATMSIWRTVGDGGVEGANMTSHYTEIPREKYFSVQLIERVSDTTVFEARYCSVINQRWSAPEKGLIKGVVEFEAINWNNELKPAGQ